MKHFAVVETGTEKAIELAFQDTRELLSKNDFAEEECAGRIVPELTSSRNVDLFSILARERGSSSRSRDDLISPNTDCPPARPARRFEIARQENNR